MCQELAFNNIPHSRLPSRCTFSNCRALSTFLSIKAYVLYAGGKMPGSTPGFLPNTPPMAVYCDLVHHMIIQSIFVYIFQRTWHDTFHQK